MEGPSLFLAAEQLQPFAGRRIQRVSGNSKTGIERLTGLKVKEIFAWGKHLIFQFDTFALRVHFMRWGTFAATVRGRSVTGDYRRSGPPRLVLEFPNGEITIWAASVKFVEDADAKAAYDFAADVMSDDWDSRAALAKNTHVPACRDCRCTARSGDLCWGREHHQERSPVQGTRQPVCESRRHLRSDITGDRCRCTRVLVPFSRAAPHFLAAEKSRGLRPECLSALRQQNRAPSPWPARTAQLLLQEMPRRPN